MRAPSPTERSEFEYYDGLSLDALEVFIGRATQVEEGIQLAPETSRDLARRLLSEGREAARRRICMEWDWPGKRQDPRFEDRAQLGVAIADLVVGLFKGPPVLSVAALLMKLGLDQLCGC